MVISIILLVGVSLFLIYEIIISIKAKDKSWRSKISSLISAIVSLISIVYVDKNKTFFESRFSSLLSISFILVLLLVICVGFNLFLLKNRTVTRRSKREIDNETSVDIEESIFPKFSGIAAENLQPTC